MMWCSAGLYAESLTPKDPRMTGHHVRANFDNMILDLDARNRTRRVHGTVAAAVDDHAPAQHGAWSGRPCRGEVDTCDLEPVLGEEDGVGPTAATEVQRPARLQPAGPHQLHQLAPRSALPRHPPISVAQLVEELYHEPLRAILPPEGGEHLGEGGCALEERRHVSTAGNDATGAPRR